MALSQAVQDAFNKSNGGGRRAALPDGEKVRVTIQPSKKAIGYIEREPFSSKSESPNNRIKALRLRFVVPEGEAHANANFFANVPETFEVWSERTGGPVPSYLSIGLVRALGYELDDVAEDTLKDMQDRELLNKPLELVLGVEPDLKFDRNDPAELAKESDNGLYAMRNRVKFINRASGSSSKAPVPAGGGFPKAAPAAAASDPWAGVAGAATASDPWATAAQVGATV